MTELNRYEHVDQRILEAIDRVRAEQGACTAGQVANQLRMQRSMVVDRCRSLRDRNLVQWSQVAGSLRRVEDPRQRLYDLMVQRAVETQAIADSPDPVSEWCFQVVAQATAEAWPELIPHRREGEGELTAEPASPQAGGETPANYCDVCDRGFKSPVALSGHRRSKAHLAASAA